MVLLFGSISHFIVNKQVYTFLNDNDNKHPILSLDAAVLEEL